LSRIATRLGTNTNNMLQMIEVEMLIGCQMHSTGPLTKTEITTEQLRYLDDFTGPDDQKPEDWFTRQQDLEKRSSVFAGCCRQSTPMRMDVTIL